MPAHGPPTGRLAIRGGRINQWPGATARAGRIGADPPRSALSYLREGRAASARRDGRKRPHGPPCGYAGRGRVGVGESEGDGLAQAKPVSANSKQAKPVSANSIRLGDLKRDRDDVRHVALDRLIQLPAGIGASPAVRQRFGLRRGGAATQRRGRKGNTFSLLPTAVRILASIGPLDRPGKRKARAWRFGKPGAGIGSGAARAILAGRLISGVLETTLYTISILHRFL